MTYSTHNVVDMSQQAAVTVLKFEILVSYMEEDTFKLAQGNIPKGIWTLLQGTGPGTKNQSQKIN